MTILRHILLLIVCIACCSHGSSAHAQSNRAQLKVVETIWGFDGRVQPGQFNPLSILLDNQTDEAIDAVISLQKVNARLTAQGGQYAEQTYIAAAGRRWVHFYPYISQTFASDWKLTINDGETYDNEPIGKSFTQARAVTQKDSPGDKLWPQVVFLGEDQLTRLPPSVKFFPSEIFPPYATATVGLHTAFLDHDPDWEQPRQEAFLSWLKLGGRLHLLHNSRGEFPRFSGTLGEINQPLNRFNIGSGAVERHAFRRSELTDKMVQRAVSIDALGGEDTDFERVLEAENQRVGRFSGEYIPIDAAATDETLFRGMRELTHPDHSWWLIFLLALCYIGLIFPGCFMLSKNKDRDFLSTYGAIVGLAVVFSLLFLIIGRRGYGESTNLQTLAVARAEGDTHWNVMQWNSLFVTSGDTYSAGATDQQMLLSIADDETEDDSRVTPGNTAEAQMRIPPYSSQTFVSRRRVPAKPWKLSIANMRVSNKSLITLAIDVGEGFPITDDTQFLVLYGRKVYEMRYEEKLKQLRQFGAKKHIATFCQPSNFLRVNALQPQAYTMESRSEQEIFFDTSLPELVNRTLIDDLVDTAANFELPNDRIRLFVYASIPEEFNLNVSADVRRSGRVLFMKDLPLRRDE